MYNSVIQFFQIPGYKFHYKSLSFIFFLCFTAIFNLQLKAQGNLQISPKRLVFEGQKRITEVNLTNTGLDSAKYNISFVQFRMNEVGVFEEITVPDPGQQFADKYIRFYPHTVMLGPNETQIIKLQLIKTDQLIPGEYRSHLFFRSLTPLKPLSFEDIKKDSSKVSISIVPTFGISIPVIIRNGESTTKINLTDIKLVTDSVGKIKLNLTINRTGNMSVYGIISVFYINNNGKETKIGFSQGVAMYTPNITRKVKIDIENKSSDDLNKGKIRVLYTAPTETNPERYAEAVIVL